MKLPFYAWGLCFSLLIMSCTSTPKRGTIQVNPVAILKDFRSWYNYNCQNINLSGSYTCFDTSSNAISKEAFLKTLSSGHFVALRISPPGSPLKYQVYKLNTGDRDIKATARQFGENEYRHYLMEGREIPDFNFTDLNGRVYNKANTKGKIVVLKCWFINCTVCVQEMPALNTFVKKFEGRDDVLFISLATDAEEKLKTFLSKTTFNYAVIPVSQEYMQNKIGVNEYPTQIVINRNGKIAKVVIDYKDMISSVKDQLAEKF